MMDQGIGGVEMTDFITDQAALDFYQEADKVEAHNIDESLYKAKQRADEWALNKNMLYVVVDMGNKHYQVWSKALVSKDYKVVYEAGGQAS
jgi:hypothetical protein